MSKPIKYAFFSSLSFLLKCNCYFTFVTCKELTHWKRLWCWEGLGAGEEGDDWGWDGWMASLTWWTQVWVNSGSWWWTGRPGVLRFMGSQRVGHDWVTELNWLRDYRPQNRGLLLERTVDKGEGQGDINNIKGILFTLWGLLLSCLVIILKISGVEEWC